jgi:hypothetical protein
MSVDKRYSSVDEEIEAANQRCKQVVVRKSEHGYGVFAAQDFDAGAVAFVADKLSETERNVHSIQIDFERYFIFLFQFTQFIDYLFSKFTLKLKFDSTIYSGSRSTLIESNTLL